MLPACLELKVFSIFKIFVYQFDVSSNLLQVVEELFRRRKEAEW